MGSFACIIAGSRPGRSTYPVVRICAATSAQQEIATHAAKERDRVRVDAASTADGLRRQVAALVADARRSAASAGGSSTGGAFDLLADVIGRADARAEELAKIANERRIADQHCERSYDALTSDAQND
ncbi:DUF2514 family protein [Burkholderia ubonensis]|uniref:DUF2514 family protein n=1 Tax=Burkholderia ubonensis TaxID=101571 RepID=UPI0008FE3E67|nr:DUF2514 family protein [Burkholderia ubonensis]